MSCLSKSNVLSWKLRASLKVVDTWWYQAVYSPEGQKSSALGSSEADGCGQRDTACAGHTGGWGRAVTGVGMILAHRQTHSSWEGGCCRAALMEGAGASVFPPPPSHGGFPCTTSKTFPPSSAPWTECSFHLKKCYWGSCILMVIYWLLFLICFNRDISWISYRVFLQ